MVMGSKKKKEAGRREIRKKMQEKITGKREQIIR